MNIDKMNVKSFNINNIHNKNFNFKQGDILKGYIKSDKDNKYTIDIENKFFINVEKDKIQGNVGDTIYFKVEDDKNTLKQIIETKDEQPTEDVLVEDEQPKVRARRIRSLDNFIEEKLQEAPKAKVANFAEVDNVQQQYKKFIDKSSQPSIQEDILYKNQVKSKLSHISNTTTKEDLQKFVNSGINPKNLDMMTFSDYLGESLGQDVEGKDTLENKTLKELKEEKEKYMKMDLNMNGVDEEAIFRFESVLSNAGLPKTDKNLSTLKNINDKINGIENLDKDVALNVIKKGDKATLQDLYTYKFKKFSNSQKVDIDNIENLDSQIENILKQNNIDINDENISIAKDFIKNEIDISLENFEKYNKLQNISENINIEEILQKVVKNILKNENPLNIQIFDNKNIEQDYAKYKEILPKILPEHIQHLIDNKIKINLKNISNNYENINVESINPSQEAISEKINLYKIQLKLTSEAMYSLYDKGINIDTKPLQEVISHLENIEQENYKKYLELNKVAATQENINNIKTVVSTIQNIYPNLVHNTFKDIVEEKVDFSLSGINKSLKAKNIMEDFETFKTLPNKAFGDNINKLKDNFKQLLEQNGFEPNEANIKALKILSINNMDFSEENILNVKLIDKKIDYVANNLHPLTVAKMLKDNFNPMDKNINDVIDYIDNNSFGQTSREKIAEQILEIDKDNKLSKEEREAIVSVYRMLNTVEKGDSVAIGNILKSEKNITFSNLLQASKIAEKHRRNIDFDKKVDDMQGATENIIPNNNITKSIQTGIEKANEDYNKLILNQLLNYTSPENIKNIDFNDNLENVLQNLKDSNKQTISTETKENLIKNIQNLENVSNDTINYLIKNNIPITLNNIQVMENIIKENIKPTKSIDDFKEELAKRNITFGESILNIEDDNITKEDCIKTVDQLSKETEEVFDDILNLDDLDDIKYMILKNKNVKSNVNFIQDNNNMKNGIYTLPMTLSNGKVKELNMYVLNDTALNDKNLSLYLNFENSNNDLIETYVKVGNNGTLANIITSPNNNMEKYEEDILSILNKFEIYPDKVTYSLDSEKNIFNQDDILNIEQKFKDLENNFNKVI